MNDPGVVTSKWIRDEKGRSWNEKEQQRVSEWLQSKKKMERLDRSKEWTIQKRDCSMISRKHGVKLR